jgi:hypothetical protein
MGRNENRLIEKLDPEIVDEIIVWRLVLDKAITYSEIENLNYIDALKINSILDFKYNLELEKQKELESKNSYGN